MRDEIVIDAPLERCFLLSTSVEIVERKLGMHPTTGRTSGLVVEGDTVRWKGWQLGLPQFHESLIELFQLLIFFRDRMIAGRFSRFEHDHHFVDRGMDPSCYGMSCASSYIGVGWGELSADGYWCPIYAA